MLAPVQNAAVLVQGFDPRREVARLRRSPEGVVVFAVAAIALAVSSVLLPSFGWASGAPAVQQPALDAVQQHHAEISIRVACEGQSWGNESAACIAAITAADRHRQVGGIGRIRPTQPL